MKNNHIFVLRFFLSVLFFLGFSQAQFLYDPEPPANMAFVRLVNSDDKTFNLTVGEADFGKIESFSITKYRTVSQGDYKILASTVKISQGKFYTLVKQGDKIVVFEDSSSVKSKALLSVYNLSKNSISLKTDDGKVTVFQDIGKNLQKTQAVNAIKVGFSIFNGMIKIYSIPPVQLERDKVYCFFVFSDSKSMFIVSETQKN